MKLDGHDREMGSVKSKVVLYEEMGSRSLIHYLTTLTEMVDSSPRATVLALENLARVSS